MKITVKSKMIQWVNVRSSVSVSSGNPAAPFSFIANISSLFSVVFNCFHQKAVHFLHITKQQKDKVSNKQ